MSLILGCQSISKAYGATPLFEGLSFGLAEGDRVGLVGPNGGGKSTLLKILAGTEQPDAGTLTLRRLVRLACVPQDPTFPPDRTIDEVLTAAACQESATKEPHTRVSYACSRAGFRNPAQRAGTLSGGWTKRLAIACALARSPDLLLMDEPTNHLDVAGILWLEKLLRTESLAYLVVSHDRYFLENVANRVIELNRIYPTGVFDTPGNYSTFLEKKDETLRGQVKYQEALANRVRREVAWLKRGPKARTRKSAARRQVASRMQEELVAVDQRLASRNVRLGFSASERKSRRLLVAEGIKKSFESRPLLQGVSLTLSPGTRLAVLGPNGSGKTTLLRMLAGREPVDEGTIEPADNLRVVYLDQHREQIDDTTTLRRALAPNGDQVVYQDRPLHVASWAKRFLFPAEQLDQPVARLSGGEQARVSIARLMLRPADLLLLDEPTNDLDIPTLEVLEESLLEFSGAMVLVTHDRFLFDRVSTSVLALDGNGRSEWFADYQQWATAQLAPRADMERSVVPDSRTPRKRAPTGVKRLTYRERREWEEMEPRILAAEQMLEDCRAGVEDPRIAANADVLHERYNALNTAREEVERLYARWAELEEKQTAPRSSQ